MRIRIWIHNFEIYADPEPIPKLDFFHKKNINVFYVKKVKKMLGSGSKWRYDPDPRTPKMRIRMGDPGPEEDEVCVVAHVAGGGAQVDNGRGQGARHAKREHVRHHVVPMQQNIGHFLH